MKYTPEEQIILATFKKESQGLLEKIRSQYGPHLHDALIAAHLAGYWRGKKNSRENFKKPRGDL